MCKCMYYCVQRNNIIETEFYLVDDGTLAHPLGPFHILQVWQWSHYKTFYEQGVKKKKVNQCCQVTNGIIFDTDTS